MDILLILLLSIFLTVMVVSLRKRKNKTQISSTTYRYTKKGTIMSRVEGDFYLKLQNIIGDKFVVIPQAHLSMFLAHKIKGQNWKGAFARINGKSVDFLVCEKEGMKPVFGIELDDYSHDLEDRIKRDEFVNSIFQAANMVLVRFRAGEWEDEQAIYTKIREAAMLANPSVPRG